MTCLTLPVVKISYILKVYKLKRKNNDAPRNQEYNTYNGYVTVMV